MKKHLLTAVFICLGHFAFGQIDSSCVLGLPHLMVYDPTESTTPCRPTVVENDTITYIIYPPCDVLRFTCVRPGCIYSISESTEDRIEVIWRKPKRKPE